MGKTNAQNLIKPVEYEDFLSQNRKMASKMIKKSITFIDKFHMTFRHVEKHYKTNEKRGFSKATNALRKPIKTCVNLMNSEPKSQKGFRNDQKALRL